MEMPDPETTEKYYSSVYSDIPVPSGDESGRVNGVRPKVEALKAGGYAVTTYFEDAEPKVCCFLSRGEERKRN